MTDTHLIDVVRQALLLLVVVSLPLLVTAMGVALVVSVLQAVTQVTDPTLTFVPKIIAVLLAALITGPWILTMLVDFARSMFTAP